MGGKIDVDLLTSLYSTTTNKELAELFGCAPLTVSQWGRRLGLSKSAEFMARFTTPAVRPLGRNKELARLREKGERPCRMCGTVLPLDRFYKSASRCKQCETGKDSAREAVIKKVQKIVDPKRKLILQGIKGIKKERKEAAKKAWMEFAVVRKLIARRCFDGKEREQISARYIRQRVAVSTKIPYSSVPDELVGLVRAHIQLKRLLKEQTK